MIKLLSLIAFIYFVPFNLKAQKHTPLPHGMVFGQPVNSRGNIAAEQLDAFMGKKTRITTTITGKVLNVTASKGGWFDMEGGNGKVIKVHFKNYGINLPVDLKGRMVMIEGTAQKLFIADDMQHFAGDKQAQTKINPKQNLSFEATGLFVE